MDILAHGLWVGAGYKAFNKKNDRRLNTKAAVFWGVFPDLFAFTISFSWMAWHLFIGDFNASQIPHPGAVEPPVADTIWVFRLSHQLYSVSHSLIVFFAVFMLVFVLWRRPIWELGGWLIHILIDIPTHTYQFFPTPILWPISDITLSGMSWATPTFLITNYALLALIYWLLRERKIRT